MWAQWNLVLVKTIQDPVMNQIPSRVAIEIAKNTILGSVVQRHGADRPAWAESTDLSTLPAVHTER